MDETDDDLMRQALALAARGWGRVHPNPLVGAVVAREGAIVGEGWHAEFGGPHAEVAALAAAGNAARGATMYVTLEPCAHHGKTPPCTEAILSAGVERVVFAASDPNADAGGGAALLASRGVAVTGGVEEQAARALDPAFFHAHETRTTWVALKLATSIDARIAESAGGPTPITGKAARTEVQRLRAGFDAIVVGIGTALADDPLLTVRGDVTPRVAPARVCIDSNARLPLDSRLVRGAREAPVRVVARAGAPMDRVTALEAAGVRVLLVPSAGDRVDIGAALEALWNEGIRSVLCEGGGRLAASLLGADRVGRMYVFQAPLLLGEGAVPAFPLSRRFPGGDWRIHDVRRIGEDALLVVDRVGAN